MYTVIKYTQTKGVRVRGTTSGELLDVSSLDHGGQGLVQRGLPQQGADVLPLGGLGQPLLCKGNT